MKFHEDIKRVIAYLEDHLLDYDLDQISRIVGVPIGLYQRVFPYICGVSISEYVKRRRLTCAGYDIIKGNKRILDVALDYGYGSHASFSKAFKDQMGMVPSKLYKEKMDLVAYPRFSFQETEDIYYVMKGRRLMAELISMDYVDQEAMVLVGYQKETDFQHAGLMWAEYFQEGYAQRVSEIKDKEHSLGRDYIALGLMRNFDDEGQAFQYTIGKLYKEHVQVPEGLTPIQLPGTLMGHARIKGRLNDILLDAYFLLSQAIKEAGYRISNDNFYWCDVYTYEGYCQPKERDEEVVVLDYYIPCCK